MLRNNFLNNTASLGSDVSAIQGAGGNISYKDGDRLIVKASGTYLSDALKRNIFVELSRMEVLKLVDERCDNFATLLPAGELRPSIETPLHALMPQEIVIHAHCVHTIAHTVMGRSIAEFQELLPKFRVALIPYKRPGLPLSLAVKKALLEQEYDVLILQNHGIVIGADNVERAFAMLEAVRHSLTLQSRALVAYQPEQLHICNDAGWLEDSPAAWHSLACDAVSLHCVSAGPLYPDHVVFLGDSIPIAQKNERLTSACQRFRLEAGFDPNYMIFPTIGILVAPNCTVTQRTMLEALSLVASRVIPDATVHTLTPEQTAELASWEAEKYRQSLNN